MYFSMFFFTVTMILPPAVFLIAWILSNRTVKSREKMSPYECGFDPFHSARNPFSLRFFLLAVIFLIFDIELALIMPMIPIMTMHSSITPIISSFLFLIILLLGLVHEWREGSLDWS